MHQESQTAAVRQASTVEALFGDRPIPLGAPQNPSRNPEKLADKSLYPDTQEQGPLSLACQAEARDSQTENQIVSQPEMRPCKSTTTKLSTPESGTQYVAGSGKDATSGMKDFKFGTPGVVDQTPTRKLFAAAANTSGDPLASSLRQLDSQHDLPDGAGSSGKGQLQSRQADLHDPSLSQGSGRRKLQDASTSPANLVYQNQSNPWSGASDIANVANSLVKGLNATKKVQRQEIVESAPSIDEKVQPSVQPFSLSERATGAGVKENLPKSQLHIHVESLKRELELMARNQTSEDLHQDLSTTQKQSGIAVGGVNTAFKSLSSAGINLDQHQKELKDDLAAAIAAQSGESVETRQGMVDLLQQFGTKCLEMSQQLKRKQEGQLSQIGLEAVTSSGAKQEYLSSQSIPDKTASFAGSVASRGIGVKREQFDQMSAHSLRPNQQASSSTQGEIPSCGQKRHFGAFRLQQSIGGEQADQFSPFVLDRDCQPIQSERLQNSKIASTQKIHNDSSVSNTSGQDSNQAAPQRESLSQLRGDKPEDRDPSKASKTWRGSLGDIQSWRRTLKTSVGGEDFKYSTQLLTEQSQAKQAKILPRLPSSSHQSMSSLTQLSILDRQKLIEDCEKEVTQIHSEFALLERSDFVDFISSSYPQHQVKAPQMIQSEIIAEKKNQNHAAPTQQKSVDGHSAEMGITANSKLTSEQRAALEQTLVANQDVILGERGALLSSLQMHVNTLFTQPSSSSNKSAPTLAGQPALKTQAGSQVMMQSPLSQTGTLPNMRSNSNKTAQGANEEQSAQTANQASSPAVKASPFILAAMRHYNSPASSSEQNQSPNQKQTDADAALVKQSETNQANGLVAHSSQEPGSSEEQGSNGTAAGQQRAHPGKTSTSNVDTESEDQSSSSSGGTVKVHHSVQLAEKTEGVIAQVMQFLRSDQDNLKPDATESKRQSSSAQLEISQANNQQFPVFDKNIDYVAKVQEQSRMLQIVQALHEENSTDYLGMMKQVVRSQKRLQSKIAQNEERLAKKRQEKLSRKELQKLLTLHTQHLGGSASLPGQSVNTREVMSTLQPQAASSRTRSKLLGTGEAHHQTIARPLEPVKNETEIPKSLPTLVAQQSSQSSLNQLRLHGKFPDQVESIASGSQVRQQLAKSLTSSKPPSNEKEIIAAIHQSQTKVVHPQSNLSNPRMPAPESMDQEMVSEVTSQNLAMQVDQVRSQNAAQSSGSERQVSHGMMAPATSSFGPSGHMSSNSRIRKIRRTASQINKEYKCFYCDKYYGSEAAAIMHMRKKHKEGTKQEIERRRGIRVKEILKNQVTLPMSHYSQDPNSQQQQHNSMPQQVLQAEQPYPLTAGSQAQPLSRQLDDSANSQAGVAVEPIVNPAELQARFLMNHMRYETAPANMNGSNSLLQKSKPE